MRLNMIRLAMLILFVHSGSVHAQNFSKALTEARSAYEKIETLHAVITVEAFEKANVSKAFYKMNADIKRNGNNYRYQTDKNDMLLNDRYLVVVDKDVKQIDVAPRNSKNSASLQDPIKTNLDSLLNQLGTAKYLGSDQGLNNYQLTIAKGSLKDIEIFFSDQTKVIRKMIYRYREGQIVSVTFKVFDLQPSFDAHDFDESQYVIVSKTEKRPSAKYSMYKVSME